MSIDRALTKMHPSVHSCLFNFSFELFFALFSREKELKLTISLFTTNI